MVTINANGQGTLNGEVYDDLNGNGTLDGGEPGLAGWTINLLNGSSSVVATTTTDANGDYSFTGVAPGSYTVAEVVPVGLRPDRAAVAGDLRRDAGGRPDHQQPQLRRLPDRHLRRRGVQRPQRQRRPSTPASRGSPAGPSTCSIARPTSSPTTTSDSNGDYSFTGVGPGTLHGRGGAPDRLHPDELAGDLQREDLERTERRRPGLRRLPARHVRRRGVQRPQRQRHARHRRAGDRRLDRQPAQQLEPGHRRPPRPIGSGDLLVHRRRPGHRTRSRRSSSRATRRRRRPRSP